MGFKQFKTHRYAEDGVELRLQFLTVILLITGMLSGIYLVQGWIGSDQFPRRPKILY